MAIYLLKRPSGNVSWDENEGFVIRASSAREARQIAVDNIGYGEERPDTWLNPKRSTCRKINPEGKAAVILDAFVNG